MARNLEPRIPEECLVIKLSYHYDDAIQKARIYSQVKTIQDMASLLESHEHEWQYRKNRFTSFRNSRPNEGPSPPNQQGDNKPPPNNTNNYQGNQRGNNAPRNYHSNNNNNGNFRNDWRGNQQRNGPNNYYRPGNGNKNNNNRGYRPQVNYVRCQARRSPVRNYSQANNRRTYYNQVPNTRAHTFEENIRNDGDDTNHQQEPSTSQPINKNESMEQKL